MPTKFGRMVNYYEVLHYIKSHDPLIARSCEILCQTKTLYTHHHKAHSNQTWQDDNFPLVVPTHKVTPPFSLVVLQDHVAR